MKQYDQPKIIIELQVEKTKDNENFAIGDRMVEITVSKDDDWHFEGTVDFEIIDYPKTGEQLILRFPLPELMEAIASATLNRSEV